MYTLQTEQDNDQAQAQVTQSPNPRQNITSTQRGALKLRKIVVSDDFPEKWSHQQMHIPIKNYVPEENSNRCQEKKLYPYYHGQQHSWFTRLFFWHLYSYARLLHKHILNNNQNIKTEHIPCLSNKEDVSGTLKSAQRSLDERTQKLEWQHLAKILFFGELLSTVILIIIGFFIDATMKNLTSVLLNLIINNIQDGLRDEAYKHAVIFIIILFIGLLGRQHAYYKAMQFSSKCRITLVNLIYHKLTELNQYSIKEANIGKILNIVSGDINALDFNFILLFQIIMIPFNLLFGSIILWIRFEGPIGLLALGIIFLAYPLQILIQKNNARYLSKFKSLQDTRLKLTNELIEGIRLIKMHAWEQAFHQMINTIRLQEFHNLLQYQMGIAIDRSIFFYSQVWASCIFFVILYYGNFKNNLTISDMVATIQLLNFFKISCVFMFSYGLQAFINIRLSFQRISSILNIQKQQMVCLRGIEQEISQNSAMIEFTNFSCFWTSQINRESKPILKQINLKINEGELWGIIGRVGSGKSTLLNALLSQIPAYEGSLKISGSEIDQKDLKISYVEQEPFIFPDTLRNNILFGREFNKSLYDKVIQASCLDHDINQMKFQDQTEIGERGLNLSGGQKARLSLARALYQLADVYLFDDPLSAVDANVSQNLFNIAILQFIRKDQVVLQPGRSKPIVILVTHQIQYALKCDKIAIFSEGMIIAQGSPNDINQDLQTLSKEVTQQLTINKTFQQAESEIYDKVQTKTEVKDNTFTKEEDDSSIVTINTFKRYFSFWNRPTLIIVIILALTSETTHQIYLRIVANFNFYEDESNGYLLLGILAIALYFQNLLKYILIGCLVQFSTKAIHEQMLQNLVQGQGSYFDTHSSGRIINRFSNDLQLTDTQTYIVLVDIIEVTIFFLACLIAITVVTQYFLLLIFFIFLMDMVIFNFYKKILSQLKEIELIQRSPLFDFLKKSLSGIVQIRIYGQQSWFRDQFLALSNKLNICSLTFLYASRGFAFAIEFVGFLVQSIGCYLIISTKYNDPADFAQAILLLTIFNDPVSFTLRQAIIFKTQMNSYNRMFEIIDLPHEAPHYQQIDKQIQFPKDGSVDFENVQMRYRQETDLILKGMNFSIKNGEKIGCVGRTGAGKSSILQVLFRMAEIDQVEGSFVRIGGQDTKQLGLNNLRSNIGIIPQSPFLFSGTIRRNLDPLNQFTDDQLWQSLIDTDLYDHIKKFQSGLQTDMSDVNSVFSVGQKQLICLARTILTKRKIIVLDEATANVDMKTDDFIQQKLKEKFPDCTIITIAHRLNTIADYNKVMVISDGRVKEFDNPFRLLANSEKSTSIDTDTEFAKLVQNTGEQNSNAIFHVAKNSFFKTQINP